ncbi:F-box/kelch-repeat protein At5g42350-like [Lolium rigidum]|uniref:F-box/kelch-repeat protein At5g42350-like n=1 Tax=Lolium rigidum TaxID=89674 RepID=UPI001F5C965A|nr:F-box/kelch-repeat protein At5g42350-like [Lolium rigidum]
MSTAAAAALRRSGTNSLSALLRADAEDDDPPPGPAADSPDATKRRGARARGRTRRSYLRLPLAGAGGCRVCACDEADPAPPRRRLPVDGEDEAVPDDAEDVPDALQCFSWKKAPAVPVTRRGRALAPADSVVKSEESAAAATTLAALPDDLLEMVLTRLPLSALLSARCACRRWRDLTVAPQLLRLRREAPSSTTPWLFLFSVDADAGWGAAGTAAVHALDVAAQRWRRVGAAALAGRSLFSVAAVGHELYLVGGRSGAASASGGSAKTNRTHKGVIVYSPLTGAWRKAAPMRAARSRPVLGVFEMSASRSAAHAKAEKHVRRANSNGGKFRLGGTSAVYEDPHRLSLRRLRLRDVLTDTTDSATAAPSAHGHGKGVAKPAQPRQALIAVGGRGPWDEPLVSGEIYDPLTDKWVEIAGFPTDVGLACSGAVCGDAFYVYCESDTLVAYHLDAGAWSVVQTSSRAPPRLRDYAPALLCCASRLFMLCVSWCDPAGRRDKVVRKVFELVDIGRSSSVPKWVEASSHPDAPMDPNAAFAAGHGRIYAVEMFRIFGKVLDFATSCGVSAADAAEQEQSWSRVARNNAAAEADAMSCRLKSMAVLHL